jgi:flagellar biosynthetic protein FliR
VSWPLVDILLALPAYALVLFRLGGLALTAPLFSSRVVPGRVRVALTMVVAAMIFPMVSKQAPADIRLSAVVTGAVTELMIGATIGLALSVLLMGAQVGGLMIGRQAGLMLAQAFDPTSDMQGTVVGQLYTIVLTLLFLLLGGHRAMMAALLDTFDAVPLLSCRFDESFILVLVEMLTAAFVMGIRVAGPVLIALFLLGISLGFLSRTMPQFNILTVGFPLRILLTLAVAGMSLAACQEFLIGAIWDGLDLVRSSLALDAVNVGMVP